VRRGDRKPSLLDIPWWQLLAFVLAVLVVTDVVRAVIAAL
jgi:hypothetical protein